MLCGELSLEKIFSRLCSSSKRLMSPQDKDRAGKDLPVSSEDHGENVLEAQVVLDLVRVSPCAVPSVCLQLAVRL